MESITLGHGLGQVHSIMVDVSCGFGLHCGVGLRLSNATIWPCVTDFGTRSQQAVKTPWGYISWSGILQTFGFVYVEATLDKHQDLLFLQLAPTSSPLA